MLAQGWIAEGAGIGVIGCVPAQPLAPLTIVAAGDIGQCFGAPAAASGAARTAALVTAQDALVLTLGDHAYDNGTPAEFANCFHPTWGAFKDRIRPTPGNHDYYTAGRARATSATSARRRARIAAATTASTTAGWHFISLNSLVDVSRPVGAVPLARGGPRAVQRQPVHDRRTGTIPRSTRARSYGSVIDDAAVLRRAAGRRRGDGAVGARAHLRAVRAAEGPTAPRIPARGVRQFVVGTGGHALNPLGTPLPNSEFRYNASWGVAAADARPGQLQLAVRAGRRRRRRSTPAPATCHR